MLSPTPKGTYPSPGDDTVRGAFDDAYAWTTGLRGRGMWHLGRGEVLTRRRSSQFYIGGDLGGAVAVRAPGFGDVFDATSPAAADTHGRRDRRPADASSRIMFPASVQFLARGESSPGHDVRAG